MTLGRPPLPPDEARTRAIVVRLRPDEKRALEDRARRTGVSVADLVRISVRIGDDDAIRREAVGGEGARRG